MNKKIITALFLAGLILFAVATTFGSYDIFNSPWPALALLGIWIIIAAWFIDAIESTRPGS